MALREILAAFSFKVDKKPLEAANTSIDKTIGLMRQAAPIIAAGFAVRAVTNFTSEMIRLGDEVGKTAARIGVSVNDLQGLQFAANRAGVDTAAFNTSLQRLQRSATESTQGNQTYARSFQQLGVNVRDANGEMLGGRELIIEMARGLQQVENPTERAALAMQTMGRSGAAMIPLLANGAEGVEELLERFDELGGGMGEDFVRQAEAAQDAMTDYDTAMTSFKSKLAVVLLPAITSLVTGFSNLVAAATQSESAMNAIKVSLAVLGAAIAIFAIKAAASFLAAFAVPIGIALLIGVIAGLIFLFIDDIVTWVQGGKSVFGEFFSSVGDGLEMLAGSFGTWVGDTLSEVDDWLDQNVDGWAEWSEEVEKTLGGVSEFWSGDFMNEIDIALDWLWEQLTEWGEGISEWFSDVFGGIGDFFSETFDSIGEFFGGDSDEVAARVSSIRADRSVGAGSGSGTTNNNTTSNTISVSGTGDPNAVAGRVMRTLDERDRAARRSAMAAVSQGA